VTLNAWVAAGLPWHVPANSVDRQCGSSQQAVAAEDPVLVLSAPVPVTHKLLERSGMNVDDFDAIECDEAFAAIALMWEREFGPDPERFNPRGGRSPSATRSARVVCG
jgi:acetyl-CoA acetyltransferase